MALSLSFRSWGYADYKLKTAALTSFVLTYHLEIFIGNEFYLECFTLQDLSCACYTLLFKGRHRKQILRKLSPNGFPDIGCFVSVTASFTK